MFFLFSAVGRARDDAFTDRAGRGSRVEGNGIERSPNRIWTDSVFGDLVNIIQENIRLSGSLLGFMTKPDTLLDFWNSVV